MILLAHYLDQNYSALFADYRIYIYFILAVIYGSIPFGLVISKLIYRADIRDYGSHNIGATNMTRIYGKKAGFLTFLLDSTKCSITALVGWYIFPESYIIALLGGLIAVIAHTKSIYINFKGGKGVASFFGLLIVLDWRLFLAAAFSWLLIFLLTKISALAAIFTFILLPISVYIYYKNEIFWLLLFTCLYIISLHKSNIELMLSGGKTE